MPVQLPPTFDNEEDHPPAEERPAVLAYLTICVLALFCSGVILGVAVSTN